MFQLNAPYPLVQTICILPDPEFDNARHRLHEVQVKKAMDGTRYTYVKNVDEESFTYNFVLLWDKARELLEFLEKYVADPLMITDHNGTVIHGYIVTNPATLSVNGKATDTEYTTISLEFRGVVQ